MVKVNVNGQSQRSTDDVCWRGSVTSPRAYIPGSEVQQARGARGAREWAWDWRVVAREARGRYWRRVERVLVRQKLQLAHGGACDSVSDPS